jgi:hypothetical protein
MPCLLGSVFVTTEIKSQKGMCHAMNIGGLCAVCQDRTKMFDFHPSRLVIVDCKGLSLNGTLTGEFFPNCQSLFANSRLS